MTIFIKKKEPVYIQQCIFYTISQRISKSFDLDSTHACTMHVNVIESDVL